MAPQGRWFAPVLPLALVLSSCSSIQDREPARKPASALQRFRVNEHLTRSRWQEFRAWSGTPSSAGESELQASLLKTLVQTYVKADELVGELDRLFDAGMTVEQLVRTKSGERNVYAEFMSLRALKESLEEGIKERSEIQFNAALDSDAIRVVGLDQIETQVRQLVKEHPDQESLIELALSDVRDHARALKVGYLEGRIPEEGKQEIDLARIRQVRKQIQSHPVEVLRAFAPQDGEAGIHVERFIRKSRVQAAKELSAIFANSDRLPANSGIKIQPSTTSAGNITGAGFPKGVWALTYDDGPARTTGAVLDHLKKHDIKATFFMLSQQIDSSKEFPEVAVREDKEGHDVASHSYTHPQVPKLGATQRVREIEGAVKIFEQVLGKRPDFYRLPYGAGVSVPAIRTEIANSCMVHAFWNVDTLDWHDKDPQLIYNRSVKQVESLGRGIILFHDIHSQSVTASEMLMRYLKEKGVRMVTLSEIVKEINGGESWTCSPVR
jgi:peptidoglycan/xylan/chitin deacetylase (PgdA/CDA1 family)